MFVKSKAFTPNGVIASDDNKHINVTFHESAEYVDLFTTIIILISKDPEIRLI